jgi:hypothetical protein
VNLKSKLEEEKICDTCSLNTYITYDEKNYILEINYLDGKFISEKIFTNDFNGISAMEEIKNQYRNENDVKKYFGII